MRGLNRIRKRLSQFWLWPPPGQIQWGGLRRTRPISRVFGLDRGQAMDRYYIEKFLAARSHMIHGAVLEVGDDHYTRRFGGTRVTRSDVLHALPGNPKATLIGDLQTGQGVPDGAFDCIVLTQTLQFIYDVHGAIRTLHRSLRAGGTVLATATGISQVSRYDMDRWGEYWRFTSLSARRAFAEVFGPDGVTIQTHGNVLAAVALLEGISSQELDAVELDAHDPDYEVVITIEASRRP